MPDYGLNVDLLKQYGFNPNQSQITMRNGARALVPKQSDFGGVSVAGDMNMSLGGPSVSTDPTGQSGAMTTGFGTKLASAAMVGLPLLQGALQKYGTYTHTPGGTGPSDIQRGLQTTSGALSGAQKGAEIGMFLGPKGAVIGGLIGGVYGGVSSYLGATEQRKKIKDMQDRKRAEAHRQLDAKIQMVKEDLDDQYMQQSAQQAARLEDIGRGKKRALGAAKARAGVLQSGKVERSMGAQARQAADLYKRMSITSDAQSGRASRVQAGAERREMSAQGRFNASMRLMNSSLNRATQDLAAHDQLTKRLKERAKTGLQGNIRINEKLQKRFEEERKGIEEAKY